MQRYRSLFLWGFFFVTLSNVFGALVPRIIGGTIDLITAGHFTQWTIAQQIALLLGCVAASGGLMFATRKTIIVASRKIEYDLRNDVLLHLEKLPMRFYTHHPTGSLMAHLTNDIAAVREFIGPSVMYTANTITTALFALIMMISLNLTVTALVILPLPLISVATYIIGKKVHRSFRRVQEQFAQLSTTAQEMLSGIRVIRAYGRESYERGVFDRQAHDYYRLNLHLAKVQGLSMPLMMVLVGLSQIAVLGIGGLYVASGTISYGDLAQFFIYLNQLIWPVIAIGWVVNAIQRASASTERIATLLAEKPEISQFSIQSTPKPSITGEIEYQDVSFRYHPEQPWVLRNICLHIKPGTTLGIIGLTGSGKTTLVQLLPRLYEPTSGTILLDGRPLTDYPLHTLRSFFGIVPQEPFLFSTTIAENIRFGKPDASDEEVIQAAIMADIHKDIERFPEGYNTIVGERGITLSGGQKQRIALARALLRDPAILILDDALSAVDTETEERILQQLRSFLQNRTSILIAHRISTIKDADWILVIDRGTIVEAGTHQDLLQRNGIYAELFALQTLEEEIAEEPMVKVQ